MNFHDYQVKVIIYQLCMTIMIFTILGTLSLDLKGFIFLKQITPL